MSRYRVSQDQETIRFWVKQSPILSMVNKPEDMSGVEEESIVIIAPNWNQVAAMHTMVSGGGMIPFAPDKEIDKLLLKYCLVNTSFFDVARDVEEDGTEFMTNLDEFLSEIHPAMIDHIVLRIRQRM
jgi:hypothetical protein